VACVDRDRGGLLGVWFKEYDSEELKKRLIMWRLRKISLSKERLAD
jgi:hypothetical protein